jgi:hypothetical protein
VLVDWRVVVTGTLSCRLISRRRFRSGNVDAEFAESCRLGQSIEEGDEELFLS